VSDVSMMYYMFSNAVAFDQDLSEWNISNVENMTGMFEGATLSVANYNALLHSWENQSLTPNVVFDGGNSKYSCDAIIARFNLTEEPNNWLVTDGGLFDIAFTPVNSNLELISADCSVQSLTIPMAFHNCGGMISATTQTEFPITSTQTVIWSYNDGAGNISTQEQQVLILDEINPTILCPSNFVSMADDLTQTYTVYDDRLLPTDFWDNCNVAFVTNSYNSDVQLNGAVFNLGTTNVVGTIQDGAGLQNTCSFEVTINEYSDIESFENLIYFDLYPNPSNGEFIIEGDNLQNYSSVIITDALGRNVNQTGIDASKISINLSNQNPGMYFIEIRGDQNSVFEKIVVE
jgi:hypothetical protein